MGHAGGHGGKRVHLFHKQIKPKESSASEKDSGDEGTMDSSCCMENVLGMI